LKIIQDQFRPAWWSKNRHLQTVWGSLFRRLPMLPTMRNRRLELADGDFIDVVIRERKNAPTLLLLHGLEGSINSPYIRGMVDAAESKQWQIMVMHFRSCSGEPNRLLRSYHSGVSDDLEEVIKLFAKQSIEVDFVVGYSLGGNVLLKWLGEQAEKVSIKAAVAVSVPLMLDTCATEIHRGFSRFYESALLRTLKIKTKAKLKQFKGNKLPSEKAISKLNSFWQFDDKVTAALNGFDGVDDYYRKASSHQFVKNIKIPTLIIQSTDDPFMNETVLPDLEHLPDRVVLEKNRYGGHVGFVDGRWPWSAGYYLERRIPNYLASFLNSR
jgi:uncharacterized protein